jgi:hypothetical protein
MAIYNVNNTTAGTQQNLSSSYKTLVLVTAATGATTLRRGWVYEFEMGVDGVPNATDCPVLWNVQMQTAAGTITAATPNPVDVGGGDAAALLTYGVNATAEGTYTAASSVFYLPLNQRASQKQAFRDLASSIIVPAVNLKGPAFTAKSPNYASTAGMNVYIQE